MLSQLHIVWTRLRKEMIELNMIQVEKGSHRGCGAYSPKENSMSLDNIPKSATTSIAHTTAAKITTDFPNVECSHLQPSPSLRNHSGVVINSYKDANTSLQSFRCQSK